MDLNKTFTEKIQESSAFACTHGGFIAKEGSCYELRSQREELHRKLKKEGNSQQCGTEQV